MFCRHCGSQIPDNTVLCPNCGAPVEPPAPQQSRPDFQQQPVQERPIDQQPQPQPQRPASMPAGGGSQRIGCGLRPIIVLIGLVILGVIIFSILKGALGLFPTVSDASWIEDYYEDYYNTTAQGGGYA